MGGGLRSGGVKGVVGVQGGRGLGVVRVKGMVGSRAIRV